ncbi:MAG: SufD family Fe-S cluster assembly protein [Desulfurococcales archaeon]|nr:SufD family Fe-S cluster assembly protein [Desulfurococcales archaeon]
MSREQYKELFEKLPFQPIADTPTVRYYTDWRLFEERLGIEYAEKEDAVPSEIESIGYDVVLGREARINRRVRGASITEASYDSDPKPLSLMKVSNKMQAFHAYRWNAGIVVSVEEGGSIDRLSILSGSGEGYTGHHIVVRTGRESKSRMILVDYSGESDGLKTFFVEVDMGQGSSLDLDFLALHAPSKPVYTILYTRLGEASTLNVRLLSSGGMMSKLEIATIAEGAKSGVDVKASDISRAGTRSDVVLTALHKGPETEGNISARGVALGDGYLAQRALARIEPSATWASSEVESHVTIIGEKARGYAVPMLEIHTGDVVKAGHEASVTTIQEDHLFYLRSRGLSREEIEKLLITGTLTFSGVIDNLNLSPQVLFRL